MYISLSLSLYIYIYIYVYTHIYIHTHTYIHVYIQDPFAGKAKLGPPHEVVANLSLRTRLRSNYTILC